MRARRQASLAACERGSVLIETAIIAPIIVTLIVGMFELTRAITHYQMVDKGVRAGARYLARVPAATNATAVQGWGLERARCVATRGVAADDATCNSVGKCILVTWCDAAARSTITVDTTQLFANPRKIRLIAAVNLQSPLFAFFGKSGLLSVQVEHEEPFVGE
ncbi:MAG: TadE/TadG family type IV pilus assembly protein [Beijerinckiaceae bacterium]